jgi:hypothetical protein
MLALGAYASVDPPANVAVTVAVRPHRVDRAPVSFTYVWSRSVRASQVSAGTIRVSTVTPNP